MNCEFIINIIFQIIGVLVNIVIACFAYKAFNQSKKARKYASFETVFAQMLAIQRSFFDHKNVEQTKLKKKNGQEASIHIELKSVKHEIAIDKEHPITLAFAEYYKSVVDKYPDTEFSIDNLKKLWGMFVNELVYEEYFNNCFKYIYNIVNLVVQNEEMSDKEKRVYVERVQALLNKNEMFCYFLNLISFYSLEGLTESKYIKTLKEYRFFDDLFRSDQFSGIIQVSIRKEVIDPFWERRN